MNSNWATAYTSDIAIRAQTHVAVLQSIAHLRLPDFLATLRENLVTKESTSSFKVAFSRQTPGPREELVQGIHYQDPS